MKTVLLLLKAFILLMLFISGNLFAQTLLEPTFMSEAVIHLDAKDIYGNGAKPSDGQSISTWDDKSGNGNHGNQTNSLKQPVYNANSESVRFDGIDDFLLSGDIDYGAGNEITVIILTKIDPDNWTPVSGVGYLVQKAAWAGSSPFGMNYEPRRESIYAGAHKGSVQVGYITRKFQTISLRYDGEKVTATLDGVRKTEVNSQTLDNNEKLYIGGAQSGGGNALRNFQGDIRELIIFQRVLSDCELRTLEGYLANKWNDIAGLAETHVFKEETFTICPEIFSIPENAPVGTVVGTLTPVSLTSESMNYSYEILTDPIAGKAFSVDSKTGEIKVIKPALLDFEKYASLTFEVIVNNGSKTSSPAVVNVNITDVVESGQVAQYSQLWGENGELWDQRGRLPNYSFAGYHHGEMEIPNYPNSVNVADFGAFPNDGKSDHAEIQAAINATDSGVIYFQPGEYILENQISLKSYIVLRGDAGGTTLKVPFHSTELGNNNWTGGYIMHASSAYPEYLSDIVEEAKRGDRTITVSDATSSRLVPGADIAIDLTDDGFRGSFYRHLYNDQIDGWAESLNGTACTQSSRVDGAYFFTVERVEGNMITLKEPLPFDVRLVWQPQLKIGNNKTEIGIENFDIEFNYINAPNHWAEPGYSGINFRYTTHGWIKNVSIKDADHAIAFSVGSKNCTMKDITLKGRRGHTGLMMGVSSFNLIENVQFDNDEPWIHSISIIQQAFYNVVSNVSGKEEISMDFHRDAPFQNLYTQVNSEWTYRGSGAPCFGPHAAARNTFWNLYGTSGYVSSSGGGGDWYDFVQNNFITDLDVPGIATIDREFYEDRENLSPSNLYDNQLFNRINNIPTTVFHNDVSTGNRDDYFERDPARWKINEINGDKVYELYFDNYPKLTNNSLGEYTVLNQPLQDDVFIWEAEMASTENLQENILADFAMIINYQDYDNYLFVLFSHNSDSSGVYSVRNGTTSLLGGLNISINDNKFHNVKVARNKSIIDVYFDNKLINSIAENTFDKGRVGLGSYDDSMLADHIKLSEGATVGVESLNLDRNVFTIFPNPANDYVNFSLTSSNSDKDVTISLTDLLGRVAYQQVYTNMNGVVKGNIDLSNFSDGVYMLNVQINDQQIATRKVVKNGE